MTDAQKRAEVAGLYPGTKWAKRVERMSDAQVFAIWIKNQKSEEKDKNEDEDDSSIPF